MIETLRNWLARRELEGRLRAPDQVRVNQALRFPWCRPASNEPGGIMPEPGMALLVALQGTDVSLHIRHRGHSLNPTVRMVLAHDLTDLVARLQHWADFHLPIRATDPPTDSSVCVDFIVGDPPVQLQGESFGLALLLGEISERLDVPIPVEFAALAAVDETGWLQPVEALEQKLDFLAGSALRVRTVILAKAQEETFKAWKAKSGEALDAKPFTTVAQVVAQVFPDVTAQVKANWQKHPEAARAQLDRLFRLCLLERNPVLSWRQIQSAAEILEALPDIQVDPDLNHRCNFIQQVARRHAGDESCLLAWPSNPQTLPRPLRLAWLSHAVQSAADSAPGHEQEYINQAVPWLAPEGEEEASDLRLLGSLGRACAACHDFERATEYLARAVQGWFRGLMESEAGRSLCEWLRIAGLSGQVQTLETLNHDFSARLLVNPECNVASRAHLRLAQGRSYGLVNRPEEALEALQDQTIPWSETSIDVQASRLRHLALVYDLQSDPVKADGFRSTLKSRAPEHELWYLFHQLANLDAALRDRRDPHPILDDLKKSCQTHEVHRQLTYAAAHFLDPVSTLARYFRY